MELTASFVDLIFKCFWGVLFLAAGWLTAMLATDRQKSLFASTPHIGAFANERVSALTESPREFSFLEWFLLCVLSGLAITSLILLVTAEIGIFRIRYWVFLLFLYDLILVGLLLLSRRPIQFSAFFSGFRFHWSDLPALFCVLLACFILNRPAEYVLTHRDPGEYVNIALRIAESGSLKFSDPDFANFDSPEKEALFLKAPLKDAPYPEVLPGFYLVNAAKGILLPQFFHLYPLWLALAFKLWRFDGLFFFNIVCSLVSILLMITLGRWLLNSRAAGFAASLMLLSNAGQVWISRSPFSEILAQVAILGGLWLLAAAMNRTSWGLFSLSALLFGLCLFIRIDSILLFIAITILAVGWVLRDRSSVALAGNYQAGIPPSFFIIFAGCALYSILHISLFAYPYFGNVLSIFTQSPLVLVLSCIVVLLLLIGLVSGKKLLMASRGQVWIDQNRSAVKWICMVLLLVLFAYGFFIRPHLASAIEIVDLPSPHKGQVSLSNELNLVRLGWYLTPLGLGLAFLGAWVVLKSLFEKTNQTLIPFFLVLMVFSGFYLYKSRAFPDNYWVVRRYIEVVIPGCSLLVAAFLAWLHSRLSKRFPTLIASAVCVLFFLLTLVGEFRAVPNLRRQTELSGTIDGLGTLAVMLKEADHIILEYSPSQDTFSGPLKSLFHKSVYNLASLEPPQNAFDELVTRWLSQGKRVFMLAFDEQTGLRSLKCDFILKDRFSLRTGFMEMPVERLPRTLENHQFVMTIYEIKSSREKGVLDTATFDMDYHFGIRNTGFYLPESDEEGESIRWSSAEATIDLPGVTPSRDATLLLCARQEFPPGSLATPIQIYLNDEFLGDCTFSPDPKVFRFPVPPGLVSADKVNHLRFLSGTFSPASLGIGPDTRELGFILDYVKLGSLVQTDSTDSFYVDLGSPSDTLLCVLAGFYGRVHGSYRWTAPGAALTLLSPLEYGTKQTVRVRAVKSCPDPGFRQYLTVTLNGIPLGQRELVGTGAQFSIYDFPFHSFSGNSAITEIGISVTPPWNSEKAAGSGDRRTLGCAVDWIRID